MTTPSRRRRVSRSKPPAERRSATGMAPDAALKQAARMFAASDEGRKLAPGRGGAAARQVFEEGLYEMALSYARSQGWTPPVKHCENGLLCLANKVSGGISCICICQVCRP